MSTGNSNATNSSLFLREICDYRANYMGCDNQLIQYFATIDLVIIILTILSIICLCGKIIQNILTKVIKESEGRKKWNAIDTTCLMCCLSNVFRIVQLANVRSVAFRDKTLMADSNVVQYVQINVAMDFIYYGAGSSVVSAAAGVNLYSDIKIGDTVLSPSKFFRVFRVVVLALTLSFNICWMTLGTSTDVYSYTKYRRAGYIVSMCSIALVTIPMMVFFSGKVLAVLKEAKSDRGTREASQANKESVQGTRVPSEATSHKHKAEESLKGADLNDKKSLISHNKQPLDQEHRKTVAVAKKGKSTKESKIAGFKFAINSVLWLLYFLTLCNLCLLIIGFEAQFFQNSFVGVIVLKCTSDLSVWVSCGFMLLYLYLY
ncbi:hypothetical protein HDV01_007863 [Terramyces sp. JEL0728]|nr:hypothetical protein HDV01_007863 [Terramyces sp. JEL0728]